MMSLNIDFFHTFQNPTTAGKFIHPEKLTVCNIGATKYQNGDISLYFKCDDALAQAHEKTGWLPIENGAGNHWHGFIYLSFIYHQKLHKLIALIDSLKRQIVNSPVFCLSHQNAGQKLHLRLFNDWTNPACSQNSQVIEIENISSLKFHLGSYYLEFDDIKAFQKCYEQTGWETDIEKHFRVYLPETRTWSTKQCQISVFRDDVEVLYNNFELIPQ